MPDRPNLGARGREAAGGAGGHERTHLSQVWERCRLQPMTHHLPPSAAVPSLDASTEHHQPSVKPSHEQCDHRLVICLFEMCCVIPKLIPDPYVPLDRIK